MPAFLVRILVFRCVQGTVAVADAIPVHLPIVQLMLFTLWPPSWAHTRAILLGLSIIELDAALSGRLGPIGFLTAV